MHVITEEADGLGVLVTLSGDLDGAEIYGINEQLMADPGFLRWHYQIWDFSAVERSSVNSEDVRRFALQDAQAAQLNPRQRVALVPRPGGGSGLDRLFHVYEGVWGPYESRTLATLELARRWATQ